MAVSINRPVAGEIGAVIRPASYGQADDTASVQAAVTAAIASGLPIDFGPYTYNVSQITVPNPVTMRGSGIDRTVFTRVANGVTGTAVAGGSLTNGTTYYLMIFGLDAGNVVQGAYAPYPVTASGANLTARMTWSAITGATKYRVWIGTTRFLQTDYFETTNLTLDVTTASGTSATRPSWDDPVFLFTPHASKHSIIEDFSINGSNRASHGILYEGDTSYAYAARCSRVWAEYFYEDAFECRGNASFGRWHDIVGRTCRAGFRIEASHDHNLVNPDFGVADYGMDINDGVGSQVFGINAYTTNFAGVRCQAGANRNHFFGGQVNLNKQAGFVLAGDQNLVSGVKTADNSVLAANTYSDYNVTGDRNVIVSPLFAVGGQLPKYNFEVTGAVILEVVNASVNGTTYGTALVNDITKIVGLHEIYEQLLTSSAAVPVGSGVCISTTQAVIFIPYSGKRKVPTITLAGSWELRHGGGTTAITNQSFTAGKNGCTATITVASGLTAGSGAVLRGVNGSATITVDAI